MSRPEQILRESPIDFDTAVAYALHPEMRRLLLLYIVGAILLPIGWGMLHGEAHGFFFSPVIRSISGLLISITAGTFFFAGIVGATFKLVADANMVAQKQ